MKILVDNLGAGRMGPGLNVVWEHWATLLESSVGRTARALSARAGVLPLQGWRQLQSHTGCRWRIGNKEIWHRLGSSFSPAAAGGWANTVEINRVSVARSALWTTCLRNVRWSFPHLAESLTRCIWSVYLAAKTVCHGTEFKGAMINLFNEGDVTLDVFLFVSFSVFEAFVTTLSIYWPHPLCACLVLQGKQQALESAA